MNPSWRWRAAPWPTDSRGAAWACASAVVPRAATTCCVEGSAEGGTGLCVLPRGAEEGEELALKGRTFLLRVGQPVRFRLFTNTADSAHRPGELVRLDDSFHELPEIAAVLEAKPGDDNELRVELHTGLTEVGTLEMSSVAVDHPSRRYKLEFALRAAARDSYARGSSQRASRRATRDPAAPALRPGHGADPELLRQVQQGARGQEDQDPAQRPRAHPRRARHLGTAALARVVRGLLAGQKRRRRSADHERLWLQPRGLHLAARLRLSARRLSGGTALGALQREPAVLTRPADVDASGG